MEESKLEICKQTRKFAADSLYKVLKKLLASEEQISEVTLGDAWIQEMRKNKNIFPDGWYTPPPHGMIVLFADDKNLDRVNFKSVRPEKYWPKNDIFLNTKSGLALLYASPVDKKTGIIGDFGITIYFGANPDVKEYLQSVYQLDKDIFKFLKTGLKLSAVKKYAEKLMTQRGMSNQIESLTDKGRPDIGHTIPESFQEWTDDDKLVLKQTIWEPIKDTISKKRYFVNDIEKLLIKPDFAMTIEPRPLITAKPHLAASICYHTIALFKKDGSKELLSDFDELFSLVGMDYMLE